MREVTLLPHNPPPDLPTTQPQTRSVTTNLISNSVYLSVCQFTNKTFCNLKLAFSSSLSFHLSICERSNLTFYNTNTNTLLFKLHKLQQHKLRTQSLCEEDKSKRKLQESAVCPNKYNKKRKTGASVSPGCKSNVQQKGTLQSGVLLQSYV